MIEVAYKTAVLTHKIFFDALQKFWVFNIPWAFINYIIIRDLGHNTKAAGETGL